jgi:hypothetical protein
MQDHICGSSSFNRTDDFLDQMALKKILKESSLFSKIEVPKPTKDTDNFLVTV